MKFLTEAAHFTWHQIRTTDRRRVWEYPDGLNCAQGFQEQSTSVGLSQRSGDNGLG